MKIAIVLGMAFAASAQYFGDNGQPDGGRLFGHNETRDGNDGGTHHLAAVPCCSSASAQHTP